MIDDEVGFVTVSTKTRKSINIACGEHISPELKTILHDMLDMINFQAMLIRELQQETEDEPDC